MPFKLDKPLCSLATQRKPAKLANISDKPTKARVGKPTTFVKEYFDWSCDHWFSFDIETNNLAPPSEMVWELGDYHHQRRKGNIACVAELRIVQLGWTFGKFGTSNLPITKNRCITPDGFEVFQSATRIHKLTKESLAKNGKDIKLVLDEFKTDLEQVIGAGGRVCAHNIEFDAAVLHAEMVREGMTDEDISMFDIAIYNGFCTFDPGLTGWCCREYLCTISKYQEMPDVDKPVSLKELVRVLDPDLQLSCHPAHDAGADSLAVWLVLRELRKLVLNCDLDV